MDTKKKINVTIFGPTSKIGSTLAKKYLEDGNNINLFYRNNNNKIFLNNNFNIKKNINKLQLIKYNFKDDKKLELSIKKNRKIFNKTNILILTIAELGEIKNFFEQSIKKFSYTFYVNFFFYVSLFKTLNKVLNKKKKMLVILFSGGGSTTFRENFSAYSLTKVCLVKLTEIMSHEIKNKKIRFNILSPGIINSNMIKKILKEKNNVSKDEIKKIKKNLTMSETNIIKVYNTINFLYSKKGKNISGKLISSTWDDIANLKKKDLNIIMKTDKYTLRRKEN